MRTWVGAVLLVLAVLGLRAPALAAQSARDPEVGGVVAADTGGTAPAGQRSVDPWGQERNWGLAIFEAYAANLIPWTVNEFFGEAPITQISPRSWKRNVEVGWQWDDNSFLTNHFAHPFQGSLYFGAARSNGFGYWTGLAFAAGGSLHWECCGETHFMSINDWFNTSIGGAAVGEVMYRTSSMILDNEARGGERVLREAAAFLLSPMRGFTRIVSGNAGRVYDNPSDPSDHVPERGEVRFSLGARGSDASRTARGGELADDLPPHGFFDVELTAGAPTDLDDARPFDWFTAHVQVNFIRGRPLGELRLQGNLTQRELSRNATSASGLVLVQDFEFEDNSAFEQGGSGISLLYYRESEPSPGTRHAWQAGPTWTFLGGVKSELAFLAAVEGVRERFREYDFGTGPGVRAAYQWYTGGRSVIDASYQARYIPTLNGSTAEGAGANHLTQTFRVRGVLPVTVLGFGAGADYEWFHRRSDFELDEIGLVRQSAHQWQLFLTWRPWHANGGIR